MRFATRARGGYLPTSNDAWFGSEIVYSDDFGATWTPAKARAVICRGFGAEARANLAHRGGRARRPRGCSMRASRRRRSSAPTMAARRGVKSPGSPRIPTRSRWHPGAGGLCLHSIQIDPANPRRMFVGISAVGVFRTEDGGADWTHGQSRHARGISAGEISGIRPVRPQAAHGAGTGRAAVPAEPLRGLPERGCGRHVGGDHGGASVGFRIPARGPSARSGNGLCAAAAGRGIPLPAGGEAAGLPHARRRVPLAGAHRRAAAAGGVPRNPARRDGGGPAATLRAFISVRTRGKSTRRATRGIRGASSPTNCHRCIHFPLAKKIEVRYFGSLPVFNSFASAFMPYTFSSASRIAAESTEIARPCLSLYSLVPGEALQVAVEDDADKLARRGSRRGCRSCRR